MASKLLKLIQNKNNTYKFKLFKFKFIKIVYYKRF